MNFDGNAARKIPAPVPTPEEQSSVRRIKNRKAEPADTDIDIPVIDEVEEKRASSARLKPKMARVIAKERIEREEEQKIRNLREQLIRPPEGILEGGQELGENLQKTMERRKQVSIEEARQLLPHGDRVWELVDGILKNDSVRGMSLAVTEEKEFQFDGRRYDLATQYVRMLARYRKAADKGDVEVRKEALHQLTGLNRSLGIPLNAEIEQHLEKEDLGYAKEQIEIDELAWRARELHPILEGGHSSPMDIASVEKHAFVKNPHDMWEWLVRREPRVPAKDAQMITEYILQLARVNQAARLVDAKAYDEAWGKFSKMSEVLGLSGNAEIQKETLDRPADKYENPWS